jgi:glutamate carboxypeptidase
MEEYLKLNLPFYLQKLKEMVSINSFTANKSGVNELGKLTGALFQKLGFSADYVPAVNKEFGDHLVLHRTPDSESREPAAEIGMVSHLDTVFPPEEEIQNDFRWRVDGWRIYGPGTVDIKGGTIMIYMILDAINKYYPQQMNNTKWTILLNAAEETMTRDFGDLCHNRLGDKTKACLVFEGGSIRNGSIQIATARKGRATFRVDVSGKSAHSGNNHAFGANAIVQLSEIIQRIAGFTDYDNHLTYNVGTISGGTVVNRVPHNASATIEMRAFSPEIFHQGVQQMFGLQEFPVLQSSDGFPCMINIELLDSTDPWPENPATDSLFNIWQDSGKKLGMEISQEQRGGLSDGNWLWQRFPTIDGLGPLGANAHCSERSADGSKDQEFVKADSFVPKALLNILGITTLLEN